MPSFLINAFGVVMLVLLVGAFLYLAIKMSHATPECDAMREAALAQFDTWRHSTGGLQLLDGVPECDIAQESETIGAERGNIYCFTLTRMLRNRAGDYVLFMSTSTGPYVKMVSQGNAKAVLKKAYVPKPGGD